MKKVFEILTMVSLIIWGAMFIYFFASGRVNDYLAESFRIWVPIAGVGLLLLGGFNLFNVNRSTGVCAHDHTHGDHEHCDHDHHHDDHDHSECGHDHGDDEHVHHHDEATASSLAFALIVLLVPMLVAAKYSRDAYSGTYTMKWLKIESEMQRMRLAKAAAAKKDENPYTDPAGTGQSADGGNSDSEAWGKFTLEDLKKMVPQTSKGDFLLDVPQIFYTAGDQELMDVMEGISVETIAQVIEDTMPDTNPNRLRAYRLLVECCAADARPLSIPIDFTETVPDYKEMGWYKLIGRLHFHKNADHEYVPILQIKSFEETQEPADWMGY